MAVEQPVLTTSGGGDASRHQPARRAQEPSEACTAWHPDEAPGGPGGQPRRHRKEVLTVLIEECTQRIPLHLVA